MILSHRTHECTQTYGVNALFLRSFLVVADLGNDLLDGQSPKQILSLLGVIPVTYRKLTQKTHSVGRAKLLAQHTKRFLCYLD